MMLQKDFIENENFKNLLDKYGVVKLFHKNGSYNDFSFGYDNEYHESKFQHWSLDKYYKRFSNFKKNIWLNDNEIKEIQLGCSGRNNQIDIKNCYKLTVQDFYNKYLEGEN